MAKRPTPPDPDKEGAQKTEVTEVKVPVNVGMDKDAMAVAETQNRQVGVDDSKEIRETLHEAAEDHSKTVDIPVKLEGSEQLPAAAERAIADKDKPGPSGSTLAAMPGQAGPNDDPLNDGGLHTVTVNGQTYTWRDGDEKSVPAEAVEVYRRAVEANTA